MDCFCTLFLLIVALSLIRLSYEILVGLHRSDFDFAGYADCACGGAGLLRQRCLL